MPSFSLSSGFVPDPLCADVPSFFPFLCDAAWPPGARLLRHPQRVGPSAGRGRVPMAGGGNGRAVLSACGIA